MDRFPLQVHLEPSDISEVTSRRVLSKNAPAQKSLGELFDQHRGRFTEHTRLTGAAMTPSSTKKGARRYRYYVSMDVIKNREPSDEGIPRRLPADLVEAAVVTELRRVMRAPSITAQVIAHLAREGHAFAEADVISALQTFEDVWGQLFPAEQTRIVQLLVRRVTVTSEGLVIDVRTDGVSGVMRDMMAPRKKVAAE